MCRWVPCEHSGLRGQKRAWEPLELELDSCDGHVDAGTEAQSSAGAANAADHRVTSPCATSEFKEGKVLPCQRCSY